MKPPVPEAALNQHIAILGKTGSGKTYAAKGVVEWLLGHGRQVCILDPTAAWWGLRLGADGKSKGFDVVLLGGKHGDLPMAERGGGAVARLVTEERASVVIDTSGFTVGEYTRWFIDFAGTLYTTIRGPLHLVVDEAHYFMPQGGGGRMDVDAGRMLHAGNRLMSGGRSLGIRGLMITQRPAKLHKDSLTCADTLIAMRVVAPQDRKAIKDWIDGAGDVEQGEKVLNSLAGLKRGEGWVWYPEGGHLERTQFPKIGTYDSSATPTHGAAAGPKVGSIDLDKLRASMAEAVKEAEANDPKILRQRIAELQRELKAKSPGSIDPALMHEAIGRAEANGRAAGLREASAQSRSIQAWAEAVLVKLARARELLNVAPFPQAVRAERTKSRDISPRETAAPGRVLGRMTAAPARSTALSSSGDGSIGRRQQRFLDAAATLEALGAEVTRETVSAWVGVHPRGGSVGEELSALQDAGMIALDRGRIAVTDAGRAKATLIDQAAAIQAAKSGLSPRQGRIFEIVEEAYPNAISRESIAERMEIHPRGGSFGEDIARLAGRGLIENRRGELRARDFLFAGAGA